MTEVILARHGETEWNVEEVFRGRIDVELNENGVRQAELLAEYLKDLKIDAVCSSPLKRALKTAEMIASHHKLDVETAPGLIDFDYGKWQGLFHQDVKGRYRELYAEWTKSPHRVRMPDGESLDDVRRGATGVVGNTVSKYTGTVVLICALLGLDNSQFWEIRQDTCGITTFTCEGERFILTGHNHTSYLKSLHRAPLGDF